MLTSLRARDRGEEGVALVVALVMVLVVFLLITAVLAQAIYNISQAGYARRRVQAINAAEAGLNWFSNQLELGTVASLTGTPWSAVGDTFVATDPSGATLNYGSFTVTVRYLLADPCSVVTAVHPTCSPSVGSGLNLATMAEPLPTPLYAMVYSKGVAGTAERTLESPIRLHRQSAGMPGAVSATTMCFGNGAHVVLGGDVGIMPVAGGAPTWASFGVGDYTSCPTAGMDITGSNLELTSGSIRIRGGGLKGTGTSTYANINGVVWAEGPLTLGVGATGGVTAATSCNGAVDICIRDDAYGSATSTLGSRTRVMGSFSTAAGVPPVISSFPQITWDSAAWQAAGYTVVTGAPDLSTLASVSTPTVYKTTGTVLLDTPFAVNTDIAIVADFFGVRSTASVSGSGTLGLVVPWGASCSGTLTLDGNTYVNGSIAFYGSSSIGPSVFLYTPCVFDTRNSNNPLKGQIVARYAYFAQQANVVYDQSTPGGVPGPLSGFTQDVRYVREYFGSP